MDNKCFGAGYNRNLKWMGKCIYEIVNIIAACITDNCVSIPTCLIRGNHKYVPAGGQTKVNVLVCEVDQTIFLKIGNGTRFLRMTHNKIKKGGQKTLPRFLHIKFYIVENICVYQGIHKLRSREKASWHYKDNLVYVFKW